jgi:HTH-type transcriptional regulator, sugar sensing transcriptional regulator
MLEELKKIGLSENEAKVYLALLELGNSAVQEISKKAGVKRPTTYVQLELLMKMGLVTSFDKESNKGSPPKTFFRAEDPEYLKKIVEREKRSAVERERELGDILPELGKLFISAGERPRVRFFEGVEGLKAMQDEFLKTKDKEIEAIASLDDVMKIFPKHPEEYAPRRVQKGIRSKLIYTSSKGPFLKDLDNLMLRESRFVSSRDFQFTCDITIYGDKVALAALRERPFGIIIESNEIANSLRSIFYLAWKVAS